MFLHCAQLPLAASLVLSVTGFMVTSTCHVRHHARTGPCSLESEPTFPSVLAEARPTPIRNIPRLLAEKTGQTQMLLPKCIAGKGTEGPVAGLDEEAVRRRGDPPRGRGGEGSLGGRRKQPAGSPLWRHPPTGKGPRISFPRSKGRCNIFKFISLLPDL